MFSYNTAYVAVLRQQPQRMKLTDLVPDPAFVTGFNGILM